MQGACKEAHEQSRPLPPRQLLPFTTRSNRGMSWPLPRRNRSRSRSRSRSRNRSSSSGGGGGGGSGSGSGSQWQ